MTSMNKFFELFRNLKSDAVPRSPRPNTETTENIEPQENNEPEENNENDDSSNEPEEIIIESEDEVPSEKPKPKFKKFFKSHNKEGKHKNDKNSNCTVNTQATGNVINVVNSTNVRWGNDYYMGPQYNTPPFKQQFNDDEEPEEEIKKTNDIKILLGAKIKPEHEYIDHISKNLGKKWQKFFIKLGYSKNRIETIVIDTEKYGVSEARYKLLLAWIENQEDPTLGRLTTLLWKEGEKQLVKDLALMYKNNFNKK